MSTDFGHLHSLAGMTNDLRKTLRRQGTIASTEEDHSTKSNVTRNGSISVSSRHSKPSLLEMPLTPVGTWTSRQMSVTPLSSFTTASRTSQRYLGSSAEYAVQVGGESAHSPTMKKTHSHGVLCSQGWEQSPHPDSIPEIEVQPCHDLAHQNDLQSPSSGSGYERSGAEPETKSSPSNRHAAIEAEETLAPITAAKWRDRILNSRSSMFSDASSKFSSSVMSLQDVRESDVHIMDNSLQQNLPRHAPSPKGAELNEGSELVPQPERSGSDSTGESGAATISVCPASRLREALRIDDPETKPVVSSFTV